MSSQVEHDDMGNMLRDYFHPIFLAGPFIIIISALLLLWENHEVKIRWWQVSAMLIALELWSFGWHTIRHHSERKAEGIVLLFLSAFGIAVIISTPLALW